MDSQSGSTGPTSLIQMAPAASGDTVHRRHQMELPVLSILLLLDAMRGIKWLAPGPSKQLNKVD